VLKKYKEEISSLVKTVRRRVMVNSEKKLVQTKIQSMHENKNFQRCNLYFV